MTKGNRNGKEGRAEEEKSNEKKTKKELVFLLKN
jgi:hypothetical protein